MAAHIAKDIHLASFIGYIITSLANIIITTTGKGAIRLLFWVTHSYSKDCIACNHVRNAMQVCMATSWLVSYI